MKKYEKPIMDISIFKTEKIRTTGNGTNVEWAYGDITTLSTNLGNAITHANNTTLANVGANANKALVIIQFNN